MKILKVIREQLEQFGLKKTPILVACSAGPDSVALLLALHSINHPIYAVNVNHLTRSECEQEALFVKKLCNKLGVPCFLRSLTKKTPAANKEEFWREERHKIFEEICKEEKISVVAFGHHQGDNQETVCKRFFEGAFLTKLCGILPFTRQKTVFYFRPFLGLSKEELLGFLQERGQTFHLDLSNEELQYTRNRIRAFLDFEGTTLVKKNIRKGIQQQIEEFVKLSDYLERRCTSIFFEEKLFPLGGTLHLKSRENDLYEIEYSLRRFFKNCGISLSRMQVERAALALKNCEPEKVFYSHNAEVIVDRMCVYVFSPKLSSYTFVLKEAESVEGSKRPFHEMLLSGTIDCTLLVKATHLTAFCGNLFIQKESVNKRREQKKYPASFRKLPLGVWKEDVLVADLYSGLGTVDTGFDYQVHLERQ